MQQLKPTGLDLMLQIGFTGWISKNKIKSNFWIGILKRFIYIYKLKVKNDIVYINMHVHIYIYMYCTLSHSAS